MYRFIIIFIVALFLSMQVAYAHEQRDADREALLKILSDTEEGINSGDIDLMVQHMDEHVVVTWLNAEVSNGVNAVRGYFKKMIGNGEGAVLEKYKTHPSITQPAIFYDDVAVAIGETKDIFTPHNRSVFYLDTKWNAVLHKVEGEWKIISLTLSINVFDNPLLDELRGLMLYVVLAAFFGALLLSGYFYFLFSRKQE
jgi:ketosteroid isomerase-like protein